MGNTAKSIAAAGLCLLASTAASAQRQVPSPPDPWIHAATGTAFPAAVGEFRRGQVMEFSADGRDAAVNYGLRRGADGLNVTLYVYPTIAGLDCAGTYADAKLSVTQRSPQLRLLGEERRPAPSGEGPDVAYHARYHVPAGAMQQGMPASVSEVYLHCPAGNEWLVKYRATWTAGTDFSADVVSLLHAIAWPELLGG